MIGNVSHQGRFTSNGEDKTLKIRSDFDWIEVFNETAYGADAEVGVNYYFQRGMAQGAGIYEFKAGVDRNLRAGVLAAPAGFTEVNNLKRQLGQPVTVQSISNDDPPVVTANGHGFATGDVVRMDNIAGGNQYTGVDFRITVLTANTFEIDALPAQAAIAAAGADARVRKVFYDPIWYPRRRVVTKITQAQNAVVTTSVNHTFTLGEKIRLYVPSEFGMPEINDLRATIIDVPTDNTIQIDIDTTGFAAFAWLADQAAGYTPALAIPYGQNVAFSREEETSELSGRSRNEGFIGVRLASGVNSPAGADGDVIYWRSGKSFNIINE